jgi:hypothetical protein
MKTKPILTIVVILLCAVFLLVLTVALKSHEPVEVMLLTAIMFVVGLIAVQVNIIRNDADNV